MESLSSISDSDLLSRMPALVRAERMASADVIEHLMEIDKRQLYLGQACSSLYTYATERLGYSEDGALKRVRVARLARRLPRVLDELRNGALHLTGLFVLSKHLTDSNCEALLTETRGRSRREIECVLARWFPRPDTPPRIVPLTTASGATTPLVEPGAASEGPRTSASSGAQDHFRRSTS